MRLKAGFCKLADLSYLCKPVRGGSPRAEKMVHVAQLVRASDCGSEGRGFEPHLAPVGREYPRGLFCILCVREIGSGIGQMGDFPALGSGPGLQWNSF